MAIKIKRSTGNLAPSSLAAGQLAYVEGATNGGTLYYGEISGVVREIAGKKYADKLNGIEAGAQVNTVLSVNGKTGALTLVGSDIAGVELAVNKGQANGYASLDAQGLVPSAQLPGFVDDVLEFSDLATFPAEGESGKIYIAVDTGKVYRWGSTVYVEIVASPGSSDSVPEGSVNLYFTEQRARDSISAANNLTYENGQITLNQGLENLSAVGLGLIYLNDQLGQGELVINSTNTQWGGGVELVLGTDGGTGSRVVIRGSQGEETLNVQPVAVDPNTGQPGSALIEARGDFKVYNSDGYSSAVVNIQHGPQFSGVPSEIQLTGNFRHYGDVFEINGRQFPESNGQPNVYLKVDDFGSMVWEELQLPTSLSQLSNDVGYITSIQEDSAPVLGGDLALGTNKLTGNGGQSFAFTVGGNANEATLVASRLTLGDVNDFSPAVIAGAAGKDLNIDNGSNALFLGSAFESDALLFSTGDVKLQAGTNKNVIISGNEFPRTLGGAGQVLTTNGAGVLSWTTKNVITTFTGLTDTPAAFTASAGYFVRVNAGATALEFAQDLDDGTF